MCCPPPLYVAPTCGLDRSSDPNQIWQGRGPPEQNYPRQMWNQLISIDKSASSTPWRRTDDDVISGWQLNLVISETMDLR